MSAHPATGATATSESGTAEPGVTDFRMPSLGADMDDGTIVEWRIAPGDEVHRGDVAAVVATDKSDIDVEIWHGGVVEELLADVGDRVDVGTPIARLRSTESTSSAPPSRATVPPAATPPATPDRDPAVATPSRREDGRVPAAPGARRLAAERGIDLATISGSGPGGAILRADVAAVTPDAAGVGTTGASHRPGRDTMRAMIAERMSRANRDIPHYHLARDVDLGAMTDRLAELNAARSISERLLPAAMYVRAVALAAARHRAFNGFWVDGELQPAEEVNVAMAISLRSGGLMTPHVAGADRSSLDDTMARLNELVAAARRGTLRASWMSGATITVTNLGDTGADIVHGVISPPQVALVGFGRARLRPWVGDDGEIAPRPVTTVTLAADHRATDGAAGSRFLASIATHLERPETL